MKIILAFLMMLSTVAYSATATKADQELGQVYSEMYSDGKYTFGKDNNGNQFIMQEYWDEDSNGKYSYNRNVWVFEGHIDVKYVAMAVDGSISSWIEIKMSDGSRVKEMQWKAYSSSRGIKIYGKSIRDKEIINSHPQDLEEFVAICQNSKTRTQPKIRNPKDVTLHSTKKFNKKNENIQKVLSLLKSNFNKVEFRDQR